MALAVGVGNTLRGDDGAGRVAARRLGALRPSLEVRELQQLGPELAEELAGQEVVLFLDASVSTEAPRLSLVVPDEAGAASTHHCAPGHLLALAAALYGRRPSRCALLELPARELALGEGLSAETAGALEEGMALAVEWLDAAASAGL